MILLFLYVPIAVTAINLPLMLWLGLDAEARGMERPVGWMVAVALFGPMAALWYLGARPQGKVESCLNCAGEYVDVESTCPHCGSPVTPRTAAQVKHPPLATGPAWPLQSR